MQFSFLAGSTQVVPQPTGRAQGNLLLGAVVLPSEGAAGGQALVLVF